MASWPRPVICTLICPAIAEDTQELGGKCRGSCCSWSLSHPRSVHPAPEVLMTPNDDNSLRQEGITQKSLWLTVVVDPGFPREKDHSGESATPVSPAPVGPGSIAGAFEEHQQTSLQEHGDLGGRKRPGTVGKFQWEWVGLEQTLFASACGRGSTHRGERLFQPWMGWLPIPLIL